MTETIAQITALITLVLAAGLFLKWAVVPVSVAFKIGRAAERFRDGRRRRQAQTALPVTAYLTVKVARDVLASSRAHAFPSALIAMAPFPFDPAVLDGPSRRPVQADLLKADLEQAIEGLLDLVPDVAP